MICGNTEEGKEELFPYRSSSVITRFFRDCDTDYAHNGSTRNRWVGETLKAILEEPQAAANIPPDTFARVIRTLMDLEEATAQDAGRETALAALNATLAREEFEAFYGTDRLCYPRLIATNILNLYVVNNLPLPNDALPEPPKLSDDDIPF